MTSIYMQPQSNMDSEREEGEIIDELDDLSDISSEEEFLLRQRLEILENYNNVLERKEAKRTSGSGKVNKPKTSFWEDFTKVPENECELKLTPTPEIYRVTRTEKYLHKNKKSKDNTKEGVSLKNARKKHIHSKKVSTLVLSDSSEESEDEEYKNKRKKLEDAVTLHKNKPDTTSLKDRIAKMLHQKQSHSTDSFIIENSIILTGTSSQPKKETARMEILLPVLKEDNKPSENRTCMENSSTEDSSEIVENVSTDSQDTVDAGVAEKKDLQSQDSEDDIESLRQHALQTKPSKISAPPPDVQSVVPKKVESDDEDSDTAELRMICLRSALLKKAIEMKKKQKLQKRLSQHSITQDELLEACNDVNDAENTTDIEYVDMELGSDGDDKSKDGFENNILHEYEVKETVGPTKITKEDEIEEDEDLLRAKLLTSLSKNLPNLVGVTPLNTTIITEEKCSPKTDPMKILKIPENKKFIIKIGDSDSEGEHEATKNLTKMHMKLAEQTEFQQKLDQLLKSTRMEIEKKSLPDVVQDQQSTHPAQKFVPKAMKHLPKSEQIEYRSLVKRMAELEKFKQARLLSLNSLNKNPKDTLKPHNTPTVTMTDKKLEERIAVSRKMIAEESAKMLKLKEEATKLSQRYKIVSNELRNITTAITLNKKHQRNVQNSLSKIRLQHLMLLKSPAMHRHSTLGHQPTHTMNKVLNINKKQKENDPCMKEPKLSVGILKSVKTSVVSESNKDTVASEGLSMEIDVTGNRKIVKISTTAQKRNVDYQSGEDKVVVLNETSIPQLEDDERDEDNNNSMRLRDCHVMDYKSPLESLGRTDWKGDPNAFLCPYEVAGTCRDADCKFLHIPQTTQ